MTASNTGAPDELGAFLKARRSELNPSDVGLPEGITLRRVPGLRREEVAQLAAISNDYYTRLEQRHSAPQHRCSTRSGASCNSTATSARIYTSSPAKAQPDAPAAGPRRRCARTCNGSSTT
ncbi:MAG: helix-turn-helix domain-containing protein [Solirubrobacterales bacterium]|nr:helix-turn-helix domain-containing protein [Solirubrobacterales bacterium]